MIYFLKLIIIITSIPLIFYLIDFKRWNRFFFGNYRISDTGYLILIKPYHVIFLSFLFLLLSLNLTPYQKYKFGDLLDCLILSSLIFFIFFYKRRFYNLNYKGFVLTFHRENANKFAIHIKEKKNYYSRSSANRNKKNDFLKIAYGFSYCRIVFRKTNACIVSVHSPWFAVERLRDSYVKKIKNTIPYYKYTITKSNLGFIENTYFLVKKNFRLLKRAMCFKTNNKGFLNKTADKFNFRFFKKLEIQGYTFEK